MAIIYSYPKGIPRIEDLLLGTAINQKGNNTKSFSISDLFSLLPGWTPELVPNLQNVTYQGNETTLPISINTDVTSIALKIICTDGGGATGINITSDKWGIISNSNTTSIIANGGNTGVRGIGGTYAGVYGSCADGSGVLGESDGGNGVYGSSKAGIGVYGTSTTSYGVYGNTSGINTAVRGEGNQGKGVVGSSNDNTGVCGTSTNGIGVYGYSGASYGVYAESESSYGLFASSGFQNNGSGTWSYTSDSRLKKNIVPYTKGLAELLLIDTIKFDYNELAGTKGSNKVGVIAQDIKDVFPETVSVFKAKLNPTDIEETELYSFNPGELTFALINAVKELKAEIELLKAT